MTSSMRRRDFITLLGGAAAAWPLAARAQRAAAVVGLLHVASPGVYSLNGFYQGLKDLGFVEGQNVAIEYRWANNDPNRLPELAADLVRRRVKVIVALASIRAVRVAKAATSTIPIVLGNGGDPVDSGLVASFNRPGGNITGATSMSAELGSKQLGLLHELVPRAGRFAVLVKPPTVVSSLADIQAAAVALGRQLEIFNVRTVAEIDTAFARLVQNRAEALLVTTDALFIDRRLQLVTLAARHTMPTLYPFREFMDVGGLMMYGPNLADRDRQVGIYTGRILKGEKPADLPIVRPTKFEFVINLQTARALGIEVPPTLLALTDAVIE
jgi:putative ABC transport system substrate-binding protein